MQLKNKKKNSRVTVTKKDFNLRRQLCLQPQINLLSRHWWSNNWFGFVRCFIRRALPLWRAILFRCGILLRCAILLQQKTEQKQFSHFSHSLRKFQIQLAMVNKHLHRSTNTSKSVTCNAKLTANQSNWATCKAIAHYSSKVLPWMLFFLEWVSL